MSASIFTNIHVADPFASIRALVQIGAYTQAREWLETRLRMVPQGAEEQIEGRILLSEILLRSGDGQAAVETLEEVVAAYPRHREGSWRLRQLREGRAYQLVDRMVSVAR